MHKIIDNIHPSKKIKIILNLYWYYCFEINLFTKNYFNFKEYLIYFLMN